MSTKKQNNAAQRSRSSPNQRGKKQSASAIGVCTALSTMACLHSARAFTTPPNPTIHGALNHCTRSRSPESLQDNFLLESFISQTRLYYRDGDSNDSEERKGQHDSALAPHMKSKDRWWNSLLPVKHEGGPLEEKQKNIDEYLEFLDRRYNRLHSADSHDKNGSQRRINDAWKWLLEGASERTPRQSDCLTQSMQDDALYVLGVAELASKRLLQKHQHKNQPQSSQTATVDMPQATILAERTSVPKLLSAAKALKSLQARKSIFIATKRSQAIRFSVKFTAALTKNIIAALERSFILMKKRMRATSTLAMAMAIVLVIQPLEAVVCKNICP